MKFLHPLFMTVVFYLLYQQREVGLSLLGLNQRSPDAAQRQGILDRHRQQAVLLLVLTTLGLFGGIGSMIYVIGRPPFMFSYGHAFLGTLALATLVTTFGLGTNIKKVVKPKIQERFLRFHANLFYLIALFAGLTLCTGLAVLVLGPAALAAQ